MPREKAQMAQNARPKVTMRRLGADCFVVVVKPVECPWSEGSRPPRFESGQPATGGTRCTMEGGSLRASCGGRKIFAIVSMRLRMWARPAPLAHRFAAAGFDCAPTSVTKGYQDR